ncbi:tannase and feruloyl esterase [Apiospora saccharicola]|uniref:Carboxylic ester hydrolase n=1 Tax=Apiospora saccharicola TaxID=335842 RepID=A0ABR1VRK5_9PEZI
MCDYSKNSSDGAAAEVPRCKPNPWAYAMPWVQYFLLRDPAKPLDRTSCFQSRLPDVARLVHQSRQWYTSLQSPLNNSRNYYDAVAARDPDRVDGYLRYFEAPGVSHCGIGGEGNGLYPVRMLDVLRAWVEQGVAPDSVPAAVRAADPATGGRMTRNLCRFPRKAKYDGVGNVKDAASFKCV